jgi:CP family cyanate transporter-like MFS transporter
VIELLEHSEDGGDHDHAQAASGTSLDQPSVVMVAIALFLGCLALRPQLIGISPLATVIATDLGMSHAAVGLLTTVPVLLMGAFAPLGPFIARRVGARRAMAIALVALGIAGLLRTAAATAGLFLIATLGIGIATGVGGALPSIITKTRAGARPGIAGGAATAGIIAGAVISAAVVVPLAQMANGWRAALALLAGLGLAASLAWYVILGPDNQTPAAAPRRPSVWRLRSAWLLALVFGLQAVLYWGGGAWLAGTYVERGWTEASAGGLIALLNASALLGSLAVAAFSDRAGPRHAQIRLSALGTVVATAGFALVPNLGLPSTLLLGLSLGAIFPLLTVYAVDLSPDPVAAGSLSAFMILVGYVIAALGPIGLGAARDVTGGFHATFTMLAVVAVMLVVAAHRLAPVHGDGGPALAVRQREPDVVA